MYTVCTWEDKRRFRTCLATRYLVGMEVGMALLACTPDLVPCALGLQKARGRRLSWRSLHCTSKRKELWNSQAKSECLAGVFDVRHLLCTISSDVEQSVEVIYFYRTDEK
uniref:Uncharacterized protein n=1 Tax=Rhipicephalus zambeziensis TaxID=60191 RepID=A0A224YIP8_9ACAR